MKASRLLLQTISKFFVVPFRQSEGIDGDDRRCHGRQTVRLQGNEATDFNDAMRGIVVVVASFLLTFPPSLNFFICAATELFDELLLLQT